MRTARKITRVMEGTWTRPELIADLGLNDQQASMIADFDLFIMGPCYQDATIGFFQHELKNNENAADGNVIVVFADCCGAYDQRFQEEVQAALPQYTWRFPLIIRDYCENAQRDMVLEDLMAAKVMSQPL